MPVLGALLAEQAWPWEEQSIMMSTSSHPPTYSSSHALTPYSSFLSGPTVQSSSSTSPFFAGEQTNSNRTPISSISSIGTDSTISSSTSTRRVQRHRPGLLQKKNSSFYIDCSESGALETLPQAVKDFCGTMMKNWEKKRYVKDFGMTPFRLSYKDIADLKAKRFRFFYKKGMGFGKSTYFYNTRSSQWSECIAWSKNVCRPTTIRPRWVPKQFPDFCTDTWYECRVLEEPWKYGGLPGMTEWNSQNVSPKKNPNIPPSTCGIGPSAASAFLFGTPLKQLGSCSGPGDVCLSPTISGSNIGSIVFEKLVQTYGLTEDQIKSWMNMHDFKCKNVGKNVNTEIAESIEKDPDVNISAKKIKWMWKDRVVYY